MPKTFVVEKATKVTLRGRINSSKDLITLYLDWGSGENRGSDFIPDRIYNKPKSQEEKEHNEIILKKAQKRLSLKNAELLDDRTLVTKKLSNVDFMTFFHYAKKLPKKNGKPKSLASIANYDNCMNSLCEKVIDLHKVRLKDIDKEFIREFRKKLLEKGGYMQNTAANYYQWFTSFITVAVKHDYMVSNPCDAVETISSDPPEINYLYHEDLVKLKNAESPCEMLKKACLFSSQTGMRCGDMIGLKWGKVSKYEDIYQIMLKQEKSDKPYLIQFREDVMSIIGPPGKPSDPVFPKFTNEGSTPLKMKIWLMNAKVTPRGKPDQNFTPHDFRHSFAINLGLNGANLYEISQLLGHSSITTTEKHYARVLDQMKRKIIHNLPTL